VTRVLSGAALVVLAIAVVWFAPLPVVEAVAFAVLFAAVEELIALFTASGVRVPHWPTVACALLTLAAFSQIISARDSADVILMGVLIFMGIVMLATWRGGSDALATVSASLFPSLYLAIPIGAIVAIRESAGPAPLFLLMLTVIVSDSAQYYTGRLTGRRLLAPTISPKKTVEGAIGGVVFGTALFAVVGAWWLPVIRPIVRIALGLGIVLVGIAGDLFESMLKRSAGVKDSSTIIPGHGGVLDRIDALLFAAPFFYLVGRFIALE
jgi:phosphatidate cytidylyltransferase